MHVPKDAGTSIQNLSYSFITPKTLVDAEVFSRTTMSSDTEAGRRRIDAERVTWLAQGFLNRLGYRRTALRPKKVTLEGERYLVEVDVQKRTATVQVDVATGEIKAFQIEETGESGFSMPSRGAIILIAGLVGIAIITALALKFLNFF